MSRSCFWDWFCKINEIFQCCYQDSGLWNLYLSVWSPQKTAVQAKIYVGRAGDTHLGLFSAVRSHEFIYHNMLCFAPSGVVTRLCMNLQDWLTLLFSSWPSLLSCQDLQIHSLVRDSPAARMEQNGGWSSSSGATKLKQRDWLHFVPSFIKII